VADHLGVDDRRADRRDAGRQLRDFLQSRRARVSPADAGLPPGLRHRRVPGLRREEVALLAGISVEYYAKLERGTVGGVSAGVMSAVADVLNLDDVERSHLAAIVQRLGDSQPDRLLTPTAVRAQLQSLIDAMPRVAAFIRNGRLDVLAANPLGCALYSHVLGPDANPELGDPPNLARFVFLDDRSRAFYVNWAGMADAAAGSLRAQSGRTPQDSELRQLIAQLSRHSHEFRTRWAAHRVDYYRSGTQSFQHPVAGRVDLFYEALEVSADPGLTIVAYNAEPDSPANAAVDLLGRSQGAR
jgi:transcriptional regulator with XRE-family HTH domain